MLVALGLAMGFVPGSQGQALITNTWVQVDGLDAQGNCCKATTTWEPFGKWVMIDARPQFLALLTLTIVGAALIFMSRTTSASGSPSTSSRTTSAAGTAATKMSSGGWSSRAAADRSRPPSQVADQPSVPAATLTNGGGSGPADRLRSLNKLRSEGLITEAEFELLRCKALEDL